MCTKNCALDLAKFKIRVNAVCPGDAFTPAYHRELCNMVKDGWDYEEAYKLCSD
jgi:NAD(P)-dependent dehydrogenase (short-subunit alcohol dehydrogenase family)